MINHEEGRCTNDKASKKSGIAICNSSSVFVSIIRLHCKTHAFEGAVANSTEDISQC